jgi:hypothetical protein
VGRGRFIMEELDKMNVATPQYIKKMQQITNAKLSMQKAMIQFTDKYDDRHPKAEVTLHPDPNRGTSEKLPNWICFEYDTSKFHGTAKENKLMLSMFVALWEATLIYDVPVKTLHKEMLKIKEYHDIFHMTPAE